APPHPGLRTPLVRPVIDCGICHVRHRPGPDAPGPAALAFQAGAHRAAGPTRIWFSTWVTPRVSLAASSTACLIQREGTLPLNTTLPAATSTDTSLTSRPLRLRRSHRSSWMYSSERT